MKHLAFVVIVAVLAAASAVAQAQESDLFVESSVPSMSAPDTDVTFTLSVTNLGPDIATDVTLLDPIPAGMTFVSVDEPAGWTCAADVNGVLECVVPTLAVSATATFSVVAHITAGAAAGTFFSNVATASSASFDSNSENDASTATVQTPPLPAADLLVVLEGPAATNPDTDVTYTTGVLNGSTNAATNVELTQTIPDDMVYVSLLQTAGPTFACVNAAVLVTCTIASLAAGASASFTLVGHIPSSTSDGTTYQSAVAISSDNDPNTENDALPSLVCVQANSCAAGPCNNNVAVVCAAADQCRLDSVCNTRSGVCSPGAAKADGTACNDVDACTQTDTCQLGACTGSNPVLCPAANQCQQQGACNSGTGLCAVNAPKTDGVTCDDGNACTLSDACASGACVAGAARSCDDGDFCTTDLCIAAIGCVSSGECDDAGNLDEDAGLLADAGATPDAGAQAGMGAAGGGNAAAGSGATAGNGGSAGRGANDAGVFGDAGPDGGDTSGSDDGCSCSAGVGSKSRDTRGGLLLALLAAALVARRTRKRNGAR